MEKIYLSRRNLLTLLSKLDRATKGEQTAKTILKNDTSHPKYPCSSPCVVVAIEDADYYYERPAGAVHRADHLKVV